MNFTARSARRLGICGSSIDNSSLVKLDSSLEWDTLSATGKNAIQLPTAATEILMSIKYGTHIFSIFTTRKLLELGSLTFHEGYRWGASNTIINLSWNAETSSLNLDAFIYEGSDVANASMLYVNYR